MIQLYPLDPATVRQLRDWLQPLDALLAADVSNYARGRQRFWLQHQWDLQAKRFQPGCQAPALWALCQQLCQPIDFQPEIGLVTKGEQGIRSHRDDSYADFKAVSLQLGAANWTYDCQYPEYKWVPAAALNPSQPVTYRVEDCLVMFNCKNPHAAQPLSPDRYSLNLWQISKKLRADFDAYCQQQQA